MSSLERENKDLTSRKTRKILNFNAEIGQIFRIYQHSKQQLHSTKALVQALRDGDQHSSWQAGGRQKRQHPNNGGQENQQDLTNEVASETTMPNTETISECTDKVCNEGKDQYKLECKRCHRFVHQKCTKLPLYQITLFVTKGYQSYICVNCVDIPDYLIDAIPTTSTSSANDTEAVNKLYAALKKKEEENDCHKSNVLALTTKHREMIADLQEKHETISHLNPEFTKYEQSMKSYGESESKLKQLIKTQQQEMKDQEDKFNQAGNPDYDYVIEMEKCMHTKLEQFGRELKDNLLKEVNNNHRKIEEKLNQAMSGSMSYAYKVINTPPPPGETYQSRSKLRSREKQYHGKFESGFKFSMVLLASLFFLSIKYITQPLKH